METNKNVLAIEETYSPLDSYKNYYKKLHDDNTINLFNKTLEKSQIDINANRLTCNKIAENDGQSKGNDKAIKTQNTIKTLLILLIIISIISIVYSLTYDPKAYIIILSSILISLSVYLIKNINEKLKALREIEDKLLKISNELYAKAEKQMHPLNKLLLKNYHTELFTKTLPLVKFDEIFDSKRLSYMTENFDLNLANHQHNSEESTLSVLSGEIKGNPFFIRNSLLHTMGTKNYEGSLTIRWTTIETDSNGKSKTVNHSETLYASVTKPYPYYSSFSHLVYANKVADKLSFSRKPSNVDDIEDGLIFSKERKLERLIKKRSKELQKLAEKSIKQNKTFTPLANNEFDALFYAKDRDNETQFRLLFTPLAQQEFIKIIKEDDIGFGDDFLFIKDKMINDIYPEHLKNVKLNVTKDFFVGHNFDKMKNNFIEYHNNFFKHVFFSFAPIFAIPLYTQHQTQEYIYKDLYDSCLSFYQHEVAVNSMIDQLTPHDSVTNNIVKTSLVNSHNNIDTLLVNTWGYTSYKRTDYVSKYGGDGRWHEVPVHWTEYIRVNRDSKIEVKLTKNDDQDNTSSQFKDYQFGRISARIV